MGWVDWVRVAGHAAPVLSKARYLGRGAARNGMKEPYDTDKHHCFGGVRKSALIISKKQTVACDYE